MNGKFVLEIELGNDAMSTRRNVAAKLRDIANIIILDKGDDEGSIRDINGNRVGKWAFEKEGEVGK